MKKIYMAPQVEVEKVEVEKMIMSSPDGFNKTLSTNGVAGGNLLDKDDEDFDDEDIW